MLKLSKLADYATVVMTFIAAEPSRVHAGVELAERSQVPAPTVAKLLKTLTRGGLLESIRGAHGGYRLARPATQVSVADVIRALAEEAAGAKGALPDGRAQAFDAA